MEEEDRVLALCTQSWRNIQKNCKGVDFVGRDLELRIWQSDPVSIRRGILGKSLSHKSEAVIPALPSQGEP